MKKFVVFALFVSLAGCSLFPNEKLKLAEQKAEIESQRSALQQCETLVLDLNNKIALLESERQTASAERAAGEARIEKLERQLQIALNKKPADQVLELTRQLEDAQAQQAQAEAAAEQLTLEAAEMQSQLKGVQQDLTDLRRNYDAGNSASNPGAYMPDPDHSAMSAMAIEPAGGDASSGDDEAFTVKTVFYGTTRERLVRGYDDYFRVFYLPLILVALFFLLHFASRRYVKEHYQRRAFYIALVITVLPAIVLFLAAVQTVVIMQRDDTRLNVQYGKGVRVTDEGDTPYERGFVEVSIPKMRQLGTVPRPQLVKFEVVVDRTKHFQLSSIKPVAQQDFYRELNSSVSDSSDKGMFVFVHGFHNTFEDAAFRTAQIAHDMGFEGAPVFFSWTSQGTLLDYLTDAENVELTAKHLRKFLQELHEESGAQRIHLIAHSMGSRALAYAIEGLEVPFREESNFDEVVFAAADIRRNLFEEKVKRFPATIERVTLYASAYDSALQLSRLLQGGQGDEYQRAGETKPVPLVTDRVQTIDVSYATTGHSYISDSPAIIKDLSELLSKNRPLVKRGKNYIPVAGEGGYWILQ